MKLIYPFFLKKKAGIINIVSKQDLLHYAHYRFTNVMGNSYNILHIFFIHFLFIQVCKKTYRECETDEGGPEKQLTLFGLRHIFIFNLCLKVF